MSEEILPKSKTFCIESRISLQDQCRITNRQPTLTKVINPLTKTQNHKNFNQDSTNSTKHSAFYTIKESNQPDRGFCNPKNTQNSKQPKLKNPSYRFYRPDLDSSSDVSFINTSFHDCKQLIQQRIAQKFHHSKNQIENLIMQSQSKNKNLPDQKLQSSSKKTKKADKKQIKRQKLRFYHCDQIIIRPAPSIKPVKVIDLAIKPTELSQQSSIIKNDANSCVLKPFPSNQANDVARISDKKLLDLINESPLQNSRNDRNYDLLIDSPSFLKNYEEDTKVISKSAKQINRRAFRDANRQNQRNQSIDKEQNFNTKSSSLKQKQFSSCKQVADSHQKRRIKDEQCMENSSLGPPFRKRNKIFGSEKKYGLKLSRAIKHETEIEKLKGELGVDIFHIIIEEDQLIRQCCS